MQTSRRRALQTVGAVMGCTLVAGCMGGDDASQPDTPSQPDDTPGPDDSPLEYTTVPLARPSDASPDWDAEATTGRAFLIDDPARQDAILQRYEPPADHREDLGTLLEGVDYETDRLVVVESVGPNACYRELRVENVRRDGGRLRAAVSAVGANDGDGVCAEVITYPIALLHVIFATDPADDVALSVTDGWGDQSTVTASVDDALGPDPADLEGHVRPDGEAAAVESAECPDEGFERHYQGFDEDTLSLGAFERGGEPVLAMRVAETTYERGDTVEIRLVNVADAVVDTGIATSTTSRLPRTTAGRTFAAPQRAPSPTPTRRSSTRPARASRGRSN